MKPDDTITGVGMTGPITLTAPSLSSSSTALKLNAGNGLTLTGLSISGNSVKLAPPKTPGPADLTLLRRKAA